MTGGYLDYGTMHNRKRKTRVGTRSHPLRTGHHFVVSPPLDAQPAQVASSHIGAARMCQQVCGILVLRNFYRVRQVLDLSQPLRKEHAFGSARIHLKDGRALQATCLHQSQYTDALRNSLDAARVQLYFARRKCHYLQCFVPVQKQMGSQQNSARSRLT